MKGALGVGRGGGFGRVVGGWGRSGGRLVTNNNVHLETRLKKRNLFVELIGCRHVQRCKKINVGLCQHAA